jgi:hypothetical protein
MGARLVAASLLIYALGVALALFLMRQADPNSWTWAIGYGGTIAQAALALLLIGGAAARSFKWRTIVVVGLALLAVILFAIGRATVGDPGPFWLLVLGWLFLDVTVFLVYPATYRNLWSDQSGVASDALARAAPFAAAVVLAPVLVGPHFWPESSEQRSQIVAAVTALVALGGVVAMLAGVMRARMSPRTMRLLFGAVAVMQTVVFVRGLPNPPMAVASVPPLSLEYPANRPDLAADASAYNARLALFVRRSGVALPANGVYVRYRWYRGPADPAPPPGVTLVTLPADDMDWPGRIDAFAAEVSTTLVPQPDRRVSAAYSPWRGFIIWARTPDGPDSDAELTKLCDLFVNKQYRRFDALDRAPYLRAERDGGVEAARSLYARSTPSPPELKEWDALVRAACASFLAG